MSQRHYFAGSFFHASPIVALLALSVTACSSTRGVRSSQVPAYLLGTFVDDYGIRYHIDRERWHQLPGSSYEIVKWHATERFVVTRNDKTNPTDAGLFTRIDWVELDDPVYAWAFCYVIYDAASVEEAVAAPASKRDTPRTGCGTYPFSRMKRVRN